ncbi:sensor histidine kinase [Nocardioides dongkuii]|uniref:sensor histidine kinase n=1 Tax=Nocardioides dongkuii TaxID=2760089 RepID=UPI0015F9AC70|nr:ATP-binding protein [Nocardioides dongkuii]
MRQPPSLRLVDAVRALVVTGEPDPRMLQVAFAAFVGTDFAIRGLGGGDLELAGWPGAGLALTVLATVLAFVVPWHRLGPQSVTVLPVLDIAALGAIRVTQDGSAAGILVVVPALWLGRQLGQRGAVVVVVAVAVLAALPSMIILGTDPVAVSRALLITVVAGWSALAIAYSLERIRSERDEAERRGAELAEAMATIEQHQRASQAIFDAVDVGLVLLDSDGRYQGFNRRQAEFLDLGYPDGYRGRAGQVGLVFGPDGGTRLRSEETPAYLAAGGEEFEDRRVWVGSDPLSRRALSVSARSLRGPDGVLEGAALAYKDVTELMRAMAVKEDFVALVSHELRTPLTSIAGYVELLQDRSDLPDGVDRQLEVVERNAQRLMRLIGDLLESAQLTAASALPLVRRRCDLARIVRDAVEAVGPAADTAGLTLAADLPDELWVFADSLRIAQLVDNLLSNAAKYTPAGGSVAVSLGMDGTRAELVVRDSGIGIAAADRDRLFTRFFRGVQAEQQAIQGVGLGLSICKSIVESHGGRIEVESELGVGSVFCVRLPLGV